MIAERAASNAISIHALREEGDSDPNGGKGKACKFLSTPSARRATHAGQPSGERHGISIHALREEGDIEDEQTLLCYGLFLSTPSARRATDLPVDCHGSRNISIHALREEGDLCAARAFNSTLLFLSTPSARRATKRWSMTGGSSFISIHALREEGDRARMVIYSHSKDFYPRPPRGGRHIIQDYVLEGKKFLSTPSARRATEDLLQRGRVRRISIHALREEGDGKQGCGSACIRYFYPRPPRGGRRIEQH